MAVPRIVVIGASAGGIDPLRTVVRSLPADLPAAVCIVLHSSPQSPGVIDVILGRAAHLPVTNVRHGERLRQGHVYVAPPDHHLLVEPGVLHLSRGPKENRFRPAIDPLFRSAAQVYGPEAIGVVLSGSLDDGAAGLRTIKQMGGVAIVQDPDDAIYPSMPLSAMRHVAVDHVVPAADIGPLLVALVNTPMEQITGVDVPKDVEVEVKIAREENALDVGIGEIAGPSPFACPECHGVLLRLKEAAPARFRCHTGHAYSADSLIAAINESIEDSLWISIRALQEGMLLLNHLQTHLREGGGDAAQALDGQMGAAKAQIEILRRVMNERAGLMTGAELARKA